MRSLLFVPGNNPGMIQTCDVFGADAVIFDLEDAVSPDEKDSARLLVTGFLRLFHPDVKRIVRINGFETPFWREDLKAVFTTDGIDCIMLPKARVSDIVKLSEMIVKSGKKITIMPIIEEAISLLETEQIAASDLVSGILFGAEDYTRDLGVERTEEGREIFYARNRIAVACKAFRIDAVDTPFTDINSEEGLEKDAKTGKSIGMTAKSAIHPNQIPIINAVFTPSPEEIKRAQRILAAVRKAKEEGKGAFAVDGKMVDRPVIIRAEKVIEAARKYGVI